MKRNPLYSPNAKSEQNGHVKFTFHHFNSVVDSHGDVVMPGSYDKAWINEAQHIETKQEKFNRIFDVQDAEIIETSDTVYIGCDFANGEDIAVYTLFYDCQHCHGSGCDICGGSGKSIHPVSKEDAERYIKKYDAESGYMFPQFRTKKQ